MSGVVAGDRVTVICAGPFRHRKGVVESTIYEGGDTRVALDGDHQPRYFKQEELELDLAMKHQDEMAAAVQHTSRPDALLVEPMLADAPGAGTRESAPGELLRETASTLDERGADYDNDGYSTLKLTARFWGEYLDRPITPREVAVLMSLHKIARQRSAPAKRDTYVDAAGYMALAQDQEA